MTNRLYYFDGALKGKTKIYKDPVFRLINSFDLIITILNKKDFTKYLYFNASVIHNILYEKEEIIKIDSQLFNQNFFLYFFLILLLQYEKEIIDYQFSFDLIKEINNCKKDNFIYEIIKAKICLELLSNYKDFNDTMNETRENEIAQMEERNKMIIKDNINFLREKINSDINEDDILSKNIDEIYMDILNGLIEKDKLEDYESTLSDLDFENIDLNKTMIDKLSDILDSEKEYINKYMINDVNSLLDNKIINFHYILLKYVIKNSIYIYQINFLIKNRQNIIKLIKLCGKEIVSIKEKEIDNKKFIYIMNKYIDSEYYNKVLNEENSSKKSTEDTDREKKEEIKKVELIKHEKNINKSLEYSKFIIDTNEKGEEPYFIYKEIYIGERKSKIKLEEWQTLNEFKTINVNFSRLCDFFENFKLEIKNKFEHKYSLKMELEFKKNDSFSNNKRDNDNNKNAIDCLLKFYNINNNQREFRFPNILSDNIFNSDAFLFFLSEINCNEEPSERIPANSKSISNLKENLIMNNIEIFPEKYLAKENIDSEEASKEEIIKYNKIIKNYRKMATLIIQLNCGYYISLGDENVLILYNNEFKNVLEIKGLENWIINIEEKYSRIKDNIEIIAFGNTNLFIINIRQINLSYSVLKYQIPKFTPFCCCQMGNDNYILSGEKSVSFFQGLFNDSIKVVKKQLLDKIYVSSIKIDEKTAALTSNSVLANGEDSLIICDIEKGQIKKKIIGHSHIYSSNGLSILAINQKKILLCPCQKYTSGQSNGILALDCSDENSYDNKEIFLETDDFEVNCICPISIINNNESNLTSPEEDCKKEETKYFLAGGFEPEKREGKIKLYRINFDDEENFSNIEYLQDIEFEYNNDFQGFETIVTSIIQSNTTGNILATCSDGKVYLLSKPNLEFYLEEQE